MDNLTYYEIEYTFNGKKYETIERPSKGWESQFYKKVLNRIESLANAGAKITRITEYK